MREDTNLLVGVLARLAERDELHDDVLGGHEWEFFHEAAVDTVGVYDEAGNDVVESHADGIGGKEKFWDVDSSDGTDGTVSILFSGY